MLSSIILRISMLLLMAACYVVFSQETWTKKKKTVPMNYIRDDWRPHFNYHPGHMASDHEKRKHDRTALHPPMVDATKHLEAYVVRLMHLNKFLCSGIVLNAQEVLTPRICLRQAPPEEVVVKLHDGSLYKAVGTANTSGITIDAASPLLVLLKLEKPMDKLFKMPSPICRGYAYTVDKVELWSWDSRRQFIKKKLTSLIPEDRCKQLMGDPEGAIVNSAVSCVENTKATRKCEPSYGLPYVWQGNFCGMNLLGHNCPNVTKADVYVRLIKVQSFIAHSLQELKKSNLDDFII